MKHILYQAGNDKTHKELGNYLRLLPAGDYVVQIKKNRPIRSLSANKYYHLILNIIAIHTGHTHEELHESLKLRFNATIINFPKGGSQTIGKSTSDLDTKEFASYVNRVKQFAIDEFSLVLPEARDIDYMKMMEIENQYERTVSGY